jgi:hypothetical protein
MSINIVWDNPEQTTLRYDIAREWKVEDLRRAIDEVFSKMDSSPANRVGAIVNFTEGGVNVPRSVFTEIGSLLRSRHPKAGLTVIVGANRILRMTLGTIQNIVRAAGHEAGFKHAKTLDEARALIAQDRNEFNRGS